MSFSDISWVVANGGLEALENMLACISITVKVHPSFEDDDGAGGGGGDYFDNDWDNPSDDLNEDDDVFGGGGGPTSNCGNGYKYDYNLKRCVVVREDEEQINSDELTGKEKCLNDHLDKKGGSFVKNILNNFEGDSEFDIKISSKDKVFRKNTSVELNGKTTEPINGVINIDINSSRLLNMSSLAGIRTILHEYIHADMFRKLNTKYSTNGDLDFIQTYNHFKNGNFKPSPQHETMAKLYINKMRLALKNIHQFEFKGFLFGTWLTRIAINEVNQFYRKSTKNRVINITTEIENSLFIEIESDEKELNKEFLSASLKQLSI